MPEADQYGINISFTFDKDDPYLLIQTDGLRILSFKEVVEICRTLLEGIDNKHEFQGDIHRIIQAADTDLRRLESELRRREKNKEFTNRRS